MQNTSLLLLAFVAFAFKKPTGCSSPNAAIVSREKHDHPTKYTNDTYEDAILNVPELILKYGYPMELHKVVTEDGYILELHRIPFGKKSPDIHIPRPVVFLQHGLMASSADYICTGPQNALGYILADAGFDVWLGNSRGNFYSRAHVSRNPDSYFSAFWDFSWEEIGRYDLAAMVDHVLENTGESKLHYIGHSQGATVFLVLNSLRPEFSQKFASAHLLAPVAFMQHVPTKSLAQLASYTNLIYGLGHIIGIHELFPKGSVAIYENGHYQCVANNVLMFLCESLLPAYAKIANLVIHGHFPAGSAVKQLAHYGQNVDYSNFQRWDYGTIQNYLHYWSSSPPVYDLKNITTEIILYYSETDMLVAKEDVLKTAQVLPKAIMRKVDRLSFGHFDFCWAEDAKELVYDFLVDYLKINSNMVI